MRTIFFMKFSLITIFYTAASFADNPIVQTIYTADPAPMVYNDTVYLYTGHDEDGSTNYTMNDWRCFSSTDMVNWTNHGSPLSWKSFSWAKGDAWAGQCIYRSGKFYDYVPMSQKSNGNKANGVAVSTNPIGPFSDPLGQKLVAYGNGYDIDPTVFIDDDGQAYLYWGNSTLWYVKLNADMISYSGSIVTVSPKPSNFCEGPWFYKRNSIYYMVYSTVPSPNEAIAYAASTSPTGPWTNKGTIMAAGSCYTNHAGVIDFKDNSYFFYHNSALPKGGSFTRSVCVEQFKYNTDGTFPTITMTTTGPSQIGHLNPYDTTQAETICWESGIETGVCGEGGIEVDSIHNGDYIKVKGVDFSSGAKSFNARAASATSGGNIELRLDSLKGTLAGTCAVQGTGGWQTWATISCAVSGATGVHDLYLKFTGGSGLLFNFNWWKFLPVTTGTRTAIGAKDGRGIAIKVVSNEGGNTRTLCLDFSQPVLQGMITVRLFDVTGRLVTALFTGKLRSHHLILPANQAEIRPGEYVVRVSLGGKSALTEKITLK
jgi:arabinoxylan arabinofuranohydrolase